MKKGIIISLLVLIVIFVVGFFVVIHTKDPTQDNSHELTRLPNSPLFASFSIGEREVVLTDGVADSTNSVLDDGEHIEVLGEPVYGDINGDESDDAVLLLTYTNNSSEINYYIALALKDDDGFLGVNALPLEHSEKPERVEIHDEYVEVVYKEITSDENEDMQENLSYKYFTLLGISLNPVELQSGEHVERGMYVYGHESKVFTPCTSDTTYWISPDSSSLAALQAIYTERTKDLEPYSAIYIVLKGFEAEPLTDGFGADFTNAFAVTGILSVPKGGGCEVLF